MRLYLSSFHIGDEPKRLTSLVGTNRTAAVITNAHDVWPETLAKSLTVEIEELSSCGIQAEHLDLREYFGEANALRRRLAGVGLVWAKGGNSFVLRRAMKLSGFDDVIKELLAEDKVVYGGYSAGAVVATPTLRGIDLDDEPDTIPMGYPAQVVWDGLGLVPYSIAPHYRSGHPESVLIEDVVAYFEEHNMPYKTLHDGEALVIDTLHTEGPQQGIAN